MSWISALRATCPRCLRCSVHTAQLIGPGEFLQLGTGDLTSQLHLGERGTVSCSESPALFAGTDFGFLQLFLGPKIDGLDLHLAGDGGVRAIERRIALSLSVTRVRVWPSLSMVSYFLWLLQLADAPSYVLSILWTFSRLCAEPWCLLRSFNMNSRECFWRHSAY